MNYKAPGHSSSDLYGLDSGSLCQEALSRLRKDRLGSLENASV